MAAVASTSPPSPQSYYFDLKTSDSKTIWKILDRVINNNSFISKAVNRWNKKLDHELSKEGEQALKKLFQKTISHLRSLKKLDDSFLRSLQAEPPIMWHTQYVKPCIEVSTEIHRVIMPLLSTLIGKLKAKNIHSHNVSLEDKESLSSLFNNFSQHMEEAKETHQLLLKTVEQLPAFNETAFKARLAQFKFPSKDPDFPTDEIADLIKLIKKGKRLTWMNGIPDIHTLANWMWCSDTSFCADKAEQSAFLEAAVQHPAALLAIFEKHLEASNCSSQESTLPPVARRTPSEWLIREQRFIVPETQSRHLNLNALKDIDAKLFRKEDANKTERQHIYNGINWLHGYESSELNTIEARKDYIKYYQHNSSLLLSALRTILTAHGIPISSSLPLASVPTQSEDVDRYWL